MKYDLALKLKNAGFPQKHPIDHHLGGTFITDNEDITYHETGDDSECYIPNLEELIEAVVEGKDFYLEWEQDAQKWWATTRTRGVTLAQEEGDTPTEAVAELWLALHTKE